MCGNSHRRIDYQHVEPVGSYTQLFLMFTIMFTAIFETMKMHMQMLRLSSCFILKTRLPPHIYKLTSTYPHSLHFLLQHTIRSMTAEQFEDHKSAIITKKLEKFSQLTLETNARWQEINNMRYAFARISKSLLLLAAPQN